jgi:hypothetical protein
MWKISKLVLIILFVTGCSYFKKESSSTILKPYIEQYLNVFIEQNEKIDSENHFINVHIRVLNDDEYILGIGSNIYENIYFYDDYNDTIYSCNYKGFKVLTFDNKNIIIEDVKDENVFFPPSSKDHIPISYNGIFWELRIKGQELIDFSYQFCEPDTEVFDQLKSIPIPDNTETIEEY